MESRHYHLIGIGGTAMASLAGLLKERGLVVTGSDEGVYPPMSDFLRQYSIPVISRYSPDNLRDAPDLVIIGNVIRASNPEARQAAAMAAYGTTVALAGQ